MAKPSENSLHSRLTTKHSPKLSFFFGWHLSFSTKILRALPRIACAFSIDLPKLPPTAVYVRQMRRSNSSTSKRLKTTDKLCYVLREKVITDAWRCKLNSWSRASLCGKSVCRLLVRQMKETEPGVMFKTALMPSAASQAYTWTTSRPADRFFWDILRRPRAITDYAAEGLVVF